MTDTRTPAAPIDAGDDGLGNVARGGALNLAGSVVTAIANVALVALVTRVRGADGAGPFLVTLALFQILVRVAELGVSTGLVRWISSSRALDRPEQVRAVLRPALVPLLVAGMAVAATMVAVAGPVSGLFDNGNDPSAGVLTGNLRTAALFVPIAALFTALANGTRGFGLMSPTVVLDRVAKPVLQIVAVGGALAAGLSANALVAAWGASFVVLCPISVVWFARCVRSVERGDGAGVPEGTGLAREFWRFTLPRSFASMFQIAVVWLDTILVGALIGTDAAAIYAAASRFMLASTFVTLAVGQSVQPTISAALVRRDVRFARVQFQAATTWMIMLVVPAYVVVVVFAPGLLRVFGPEFGAAEKALVVLAAGAVVSVSCGPVDMVLLMAGRSVWSLANMAVGLSVNVVGDLVLVPRYGITGAGIAYAASIVVINLAPLVQVRWSLGMHPYSRATAVVGAAGVTVFGGVGLSVRHMVGPTLAGAVLAASVAALLYALVLAQYREALRLTHLGAVFRLRPRAAL